MTETQNSCELIGPAGFTFCGVGCDEFHLEYVPDNQNTYVYKPSSYEVHEQKFDAHDGGYFYGTTMEPKEFKLRCLFQDQHVNNGTMTEIFNFYKRGRTGRLVFAKRPWIYYNATVTNVEITQLITYMGGIITISMKAYYPFARSDQAIIYENDPNRRDLLDNSAMMEGMEWDTRKNFAEDPITESTTNNPILLYNPGTERAHVAIRLSGDMSEGISIVNVTTGQRCVVRGINTTSGTNAGDTVVIDSLSGKVLVEDTNGDVDYGFLYHDQDYIELEPNYPAYRKVSIAGLQGSNRLTTDAYFRQEDIGRYIMFYENGDSGVVGNAIIGQMILGEDSDDDIFVKAKIIDVSEDGKTISINKNLVDDINTVSDIVMYNEIRINKLGESMNITKLIFDYKPTFN